MGLCSNQTTECEDILFCCWIHSLNSWVLGLTNVTLSVTLNGGDKQKPFKCYCFIFIVHTLSLEHSNIGWGFMAYRSICRSHVNTSQFESTWISNATLRYCAFYFWYTFMFGRIHTFVKLDIGCFVVTKRIQSNRIWEHPYRGCSPIQKWRIYCHCRMFLWQAR